MRLVVQSNGVAPLSCSAVEKYCLLAQARMIDGGEFGDMANRDPAAPAMGIGLAAHLIEVHP